MTPEQLLAAILTAYHESDGFHISFELKEMLKLAEEDFDGVEANGNGPSRRAPHDENFY